MDLQNSYSDTNAGVKEHFFAGAGGISLSSISPPPGDGVSGASAVGGSGGVINYGGPTSTMTSTPVVTSYISASNLTAGGSVKISADSNTRTLSYSSMAGGGGIEISEARSSTNTSGANTTAYVGSNAHITAGNDFTMNTDSNHYIESKSRAVGGGVISAKDAETSAKLTYNNTSYIGEGATVTAFDAVGIYANSTAHGRTDVYTESWGLGAGADSDNTHSKDDAGIHITGTTQTQVGEGVTLTGESVDINARVDQLSGDSDAYAKAINPVLFGVAVAYADAVVKLNSDVKNLVGVNLSGADTAAQTTITGYRGVDITTGTADLVPDGWADVLAVAIIPPQDADEYEEANSNEIIDVEKDTLIVVGARDESRAGPTIITSPQHGSYC